MAYPLIGLPIVSDMFHLSEHELDLLRDPIGFSMPVQTAATEKMWIALAGTVPVISSSFFPCW